MIEIFKDDIAHIVYASDDKFTEILGVSLVSLYENSKDMTDIVIYVLDSGIKDENKRKIELVSNVYNRSLPIWVPAKNISKELSIDVTVDRGSLSQYARLFISSLLPEYLSRVLYLDCDVIVNYSIKELWNLNLHEKMIGALLDAFSKYYRIVLGLKPNDVMFNSGVMLIDLEKWRERDVEVKLLEFINRKKGRVQQGDQGVLNAVLSKDTYCFEPCFNSVTIYYDFSYKGMLTYRKPPMCYTEEQIKEAVEKPRIIHFTTSFLSKRPWVEECGHRYVGEWMRYKQMSPWNDGVLWKCSNSRWKYLAIIVYKSLPECIAIRIAGVIQAYVRPVKNRYITYK